MAPMTREQRGTLLVVVVAVGMLAALLYHRWWSVDLYPFNTFLFRPEDRFNDLRHGWRFFAERLPLAQTPWPVAPGPLTVVYRLLGLLPFSAALALVVGTAPAVVLAASWRAFRGASRRGALARSLALTALAYPVWFAADRANLEVLVFALTWAAVEAFRARRLGASAVLLGLAVAFKPFPGALLLLFLAERRLREVAVVLAVAAAVTAASQVYLLRFTPFEYATVADAARRYFESAVLRNDGLVFGHSAFGLIKVLVCKLSPASPPPAWPAGDATNRALVLPYQLATVAFGLGLAAWAWRSRPAPWRAVTVACCAIGLLPVVSVDYRLLNLFIPALLFVRDAPPTRCDAAWVVLFGLLLSPRAYDHYVFSRACRLPWYEVTSSVVTTPILLAILMALALASPHRAGPGLPAAQA